MNNSLWTKVALGTAVAFGGFAVQTAPASAISLGFDESSFSDVDTTDILEDKVVNPGDTFQAEVRLDTSNFPSGSFDFDGTPEELEYQVNLSEEVNFVSNNVSTSNTFNSSTILAKTSDRVEIKYTGNYDQNQQILADTLTFKATSNVENDGAADLNFNGSKLRDGDGIQLTTTNGDFTNQNAAGETAVDLNADTQVPFEAETSFGLIAVAGFFGYRKFRQYKAKRNNDSVAA